MIGAGILFAHGNQILDSDTVVFTSSNLPIILIDTHGDSIPVGPKITAEMKIIYNGDEIRNAITDTVYHYNGKIGIEIRGESSKRFEKKQYGIETRDPSGSGIDVSLLGLPAESDWVLYAAYDEKTFIRDFLAYRLSRSMGRYASRAHHCELVLNGRYWGIYILFENIKRGKNRVDISKMDATDTTGNNLTGGYIIRIDKDDLADPGSGWFSPNPPYGAPTKRIRYQYYYPQADEIVTEQKTYIQNFIHSFETVMDSSGYTDTINGYSKYLDIGSAVDHFILNELTRNVDAYRLSTYMYKDKYSKGGKLSLGPVWDFTNALGNSDYYDGLLTDGWELAYLTTNPYFLGFDEALVPFWWKKLFEDLEFIEKVKIRWIELRHNQFTLETIEGITDSTAASLNEAQQRNFVKWPILGIYTYTEEVEFLKNWLHDRIAWMDVELTGNSLDIFDHIDQSPSTFRLYQNYPNPFNPSTTITFDLPTKSFVTVKIFDILGKEVTTIVTDELPAGRYSRMWNASGVPSGVYFCRIAAGSSVETTKLLLCR
jgi:hypothetical protein